MLGLFKIYSRILIRLRWQAHWRCEEPVVAFESDDWGLKRNSQETLLSKFGTPSEKAEEETEKSEDLEKLYGLLESFKDKSGRPACFTANFIMASPDFEAIKTGQFKQYYDLFLDETMPAQLLEKYKEGIKRKVFFPQYHGRYHFWPRAWLRDLQQGNQGALELFNARCNAGLSLLKGNLWRYHSEYLDWNVGYYSKTEEILPYLKEALEVFKRIFGYQPLSTIPPHYIYSKEAALAWRALGIKYIQGMNYSILRKARNNQPVIRQHYLGELLSDGLFCLARTVKFEPRPERTKQGLKAALGQISVLLENRIPVIIDTHRINYTGRYRDEALRQLGELLNFLKEQNPVFITSAELGQAIGNCGKFRDVFTGNERSLKPISKAWQPSSRFIYSRLSQVVIKRY